MLIPISLSHDLPDRSFLKWFSLIIVEIGTDVGMDMGFKFFVGNFRINFISFTFVNTGKQRPSTPASAFIGVGS